MGAAHMISRVGMALAGFLAFAPISAFAQGEISEADRASLVGAIERGQAIYNYDQAAWHTTDAMLEQISDPASEGIRGWIINELDDGLEAVFFRPAGDGFEAVWSGVYGGGKVRDTTKYEPGERPFSAKEIALARAAKLPRNEEMQRCSAKPFNSVVIPTGKNDGSLFVYYLVPQETFDAVPLGGHYRFEIRDDEIVDRRKFTNSCLSLPTGNGDDEKKPAGLFVTHVLDPVPTEIHVFSTFAARIPIYVSTTANERTWVSEISSGKSRIRLVER